MIKDLKNAVFAAVIGFIIFLFIGIPFIEGILGKLSEQPETIRLLIALISSSVISGRLQKSE